MNPTDDIRMVALCAIPCDQRLEIEMAGRRAYEMGQELAHCPHPPEASIDRGDGQRTPAAFIWRLGWNEAWEDDGAANKFRRIKRPSAKY